MTILIDGYNLLHVTRFAPQGQSENILRKSREAMLRFLSQLLSESESKETVVIFDAPDRRQSLPDAYQFAGIDIRFAREYNSADDLIEELIQAESTPDRLTIVSSDHRLHRFAARRNAKCIDSDVWFDRMVERNENAHQNQMEVAPKPSKPIPTVTSDEWIDLFQSDELRQLERQADALRRSKSLTQDRSPKSEESVNIENPFPDDFFDD